MVQSGISAQVVQRTGGARLQVPGAIDNVSDPSVDRRAGTHRARLQGDDQRGIVETPTTDGSRGVTEGEYLGVGGRVASTLALVVPGGNDLPVDDHHRPNRDIAVADSQDSFGEGQAHQRVEIESCRIGTGHPADPTQLRTTPSVARGRPVRGPPAR